MNARTFRLVFSTVALAAIATANAAQAQTRPKAADDIDGIDGTIVVTARKRAEALVDVPVAVTVLTSDILQNADITSPSDAIALTPSGGIVTTDSGVNQRFQLRGIGGAQGAVIGEPGVAVYVDEAYASGVRTNYPDFFDIERIEVLRGPQGALYGRNAVGGAINILTARPDPAAIGARAELRYGSFNRFEARAMLNLPLSDQLAVRGVAWGIDQSGGEYYNPALKAQTDQSSSYGGRLSIGGTTGKIRWRVIGEAGNRTGPSNIVVAENLETATALGRNTPDRVNVNDARLTAQATIDTDIGEGVLVYGYKNYVLHLSSDEDFTALTIPNTNGDQRQADTVERVRSHFVEARLSGNTGRIRYLVGGNFYNESFRQNALASTIDTGTNTAPLSCNILFYNPLVPGGFVPVPIQALNPAYPLFRNCADQSVRRNAQTTDSVAAFGELTYAITPRVDLTGSVRWSTDRKGLGFEQVSGPLYSAFFPTAAFANRARFSKLSPSATLSWRPGAGVQLYVKYNQGFRAGGFNATFLAGSSLAYGQENFENFEGGGKVELLNRKLLISITGYRLEQKNLVVPTLVFSPATATVIGVTLANAGRARTDGIELEARASIHKSLFVGAGISFLDPAFRSGFSGATPLAGISLPGVAKRSGYILGTFTPKLGDTLKGEFTVNYRFRAGGRFQVDTSDPLEAFDQLNLSAGLTYGHFNVVAFVDNATDQRYKNNLVSTFSGLTLTGRSTGRTAGARLNISL